MTPGAVLLGLLDAVVHASETAVSVTPAGRALFQMLGVFAEFEREIIRERIYAGMDRARRKGTKSGKAIGRPTISKAKAAQIRAELAKGTGILKTAKLLKAGAAVVHRIKRESNL